MILKNKVGTKERIGVFLKRYSYIFAAVTVLVIMAIIIGVNVTNNEDIDKNIQNENFGKENIVECYRKNQKLLVVAAEVKCADDVGNVKAEKDCLHGKQDNRQKFGIDLDAEVGDDLGKHHIGANQDSTGNKQILQKHP